MKLFLFIILTIAYNNASMAQKTYLKIQKGPSERSVVMYPPGTEFELRNEHGYIVMKNSDTPYSLEIKSRHKLTVSPNYKNEKDIFILTEGKVEKVLTARFMAKESRMETLFIDDRNVTAHKKVTESNLRKGYKNLEFELSNGISFTYKDGKYSAMFRNAKIEITGKYLINTEIGILKLSFDPKTGVVWWVFES